MRIPLRTTGLLLLALGLTVGCQTLSSPFSAPSQPSTAAKDVSGTLILNLLVPAQALPGYQTATLPGGTSTLTLTLTNAGLLGAPRVVAVPLVGGQSTYNVTMTSLPPGTGYVLEGEAKNGSGTRLAYTNRIDPAAGDPALNQPNVDNPYAQPPLAFKVKSGINNVGLGLRILPVAGSTQGGASAAINGKAQVMAGYLRTLTVSPTTAIGAGYVVAATLNTATLVSASKLRSDMNDLHVLYWDGTRYVELTREIENPNAANTIVRFRTLRPVAASGSDANYRLAYGNNLAGPAASDSAQVYDYFESFEYPNANLAGNGWGTVRGSGTAAVSSSRAKSGANSLHLDSNVGDLIKDFSLPYAFPANFAMRGYLFDDATDTTVHNWIGPQPNEAVGGGVLGVSVSGSTTKMSYTPAPGGTWYATAINRTTAWHPVEVRRYNGTVEFWLDNTQVATASDTRAFGALYLRCGNGVAGMACLADWDDLSVRQYVLPEPAVNVGAEGSL